MFGKKLFIGVIALGVSSLALASGDAAYAPAPAAFTPNVYAGLKAGYSLSGWDSANDYVDVKNAHGFAAGIFAGWQPLQHFALEAAWIPNIYQLKIDGNKADAFQHGVVELAGKIIAPLPTVDGVDVYAKFGFNWLYSKENLNGKHADAYGASFGPGFTWEFMPNWKAGASYTVYNAFSNRKLLDNDWYPAHQHVFMAEISYSFPIE